MLLISSNAWKKLCCNSTNAPWNLLILLKRKRLLLTLVVPFPFILASNGHLKFAPKLNNITLSAERTWKESQIWNDFEIISTVNLGYKHPLSSPPHPTNSVSSGSPIQFKYRNYHNYQLSIINYHNYHQFSLNITGGTRHNAQGRFRCNLQVNRLMIKRKVIRGAILYNWQAWQKIWEGRSAIFCILSPSRL